MLNGASHLSGFSSVGIPTCKSEKQSAQVITLGGKVYPTKSDQTLPPAFFSLPFATTMMAEWAAAGICGEACGWACALLSLFMFGSYSVPVKSRKLQSIPVDPLVFQTYRTLTAFVVSWSVLLLGVDFTFTPWGIVSGFCWVPGGISGIYAVRSAGLAVSQGVWSCVIVAVSMTWGVVVFSENVTSVGAACGAALLLMAGLVGMSYFSSPKKNRRQAKDSPKLSYSLPCAGAGESVQSGSNHQSNDTAGESTPLCPKHGQATAADNDGESIEREQSNSTKEPVPKLSSEETSRNRPFQQRDINSRDLVRYGSIRVNELPPEASKKIILCGIFGLTKYQLGVLAAINNGLLAGSILMPLKCAGPSHQGLQFVISQGIGALTATLTFWLARFIYSSFIEGSLLDGYNTLPPFHVKDMAVPGCLAGSLWSIGNIAGIMAVTTLGLGVGQSVIQASMLISGLWGLFYYREVTGAKDITGWLCSAFIGLLGVMWLSRAHVPI